MRKRYPVHITDSMEGIIYYPADFKPNEPIEKISFGTSSVQAKCFAHPKGKNTIVISEDIRNKLFFPNFNIPLHLFVHDQTLFIGPLIGIFTSGFTPIKIRPIGDRSHFIGKLLSLKKAVGALPFVFGEQHIDWEKGLIKGYFYENQVWETREIPFPNVIYDRLPNRRSENKTIQRKIKQKLQDEYLIPWYNPGFFNKLDIHNMLLNVGEVKSFLPETHSFSSFSHIENMLFQYGHIYIKPMNGSLGLGVHQILHDKHENVYYCRYRDKYGENKLKKFPTLEKLIHHIFTNRKLEKMLIQQGIHLIRVNKRLVDFRIHTNKDDQGDWKVTAIAAKIAGPGSPTTHVKNGGEIKTLREVFPDDEVRKQYEEKLTNTALLLSKALENQVDGIIGEIGFDLGIDKNGDIWLFEANSKPGRSIFAHPHLNRFELLTRKLSLAFAVFLSEKAIKKPEEVFK
ncbi:YheC/YheD family protein [Bacillus aquiflavi]|uniref:YheC/YheD family protein n=1 Tax=Bacillus aquiflavi TaxID=2672567 RepID=A0A6B3VNZ4_9BACI|nr:YheC/YheD family protein [Bacillus aquiflavi]MBA4535644.1 YheC/YheD family protein [Bacillus aquiflavi]NEY80020.1 YheC/YheD family protein [Bacillus aquiflavi]UAC48955.1 YheC/YheD family protein [Bacillus aquiflavi]